MGQRVCCQFSAPRGPAKKFNFELFGEPLLEANNGRKTWSEGSDFEENLCGRRYFSRRIILAGLSPIRRRQRGKKFKVELFGRRAKKFNLEFFGRVARAGRPLR